MRGRWWAVLAAGTVAIGGLAGNALAAWMNPGSPITGNLMFNQPTITWAPSPLTMFVPILQPDTIEGISVGRDDLSPYATISVSFGPQSTWSQANPNLYIFTYRPLWDAFNGTTVPFGGPPPITTVAGTQGDLDDHFTAVDVFARHAQIMRQNWAKPLPVIPPERMVLFVDPAGFNNVFGSPPAGALPWAYNEFFQYAVHY